MAAPAAGLERGRSLLAGAVRTAAAMGSCVGTLVSKQQDPHASHGPFVTLNDRSGLQERRSKRETR
jgi:hypothetical protein